MQVKLKNVRLAFPNLFVAKAVNAGDAPKFSASFLIPYGNAQIAMIDKAIDAVAADKWGAKGASTAKTLRAGGKVCLRDGAIKEDYTGFEGHMFVSATNSTRPLVIDADKSPLTAEDGKPYAGCYVNVSLDIWAQDNAWGKRVNASLSGVQFLRDGDAFAGGAPASVDDFDDVTEGADAEDLA